MPVIGITGTNGKTTTKELLTDVSFTLEKGEIHLGFVRPPILDDTHFPPAPAGALERTPTPKSVADSEFLALGEGARIWLVEAAAAGTGKMRVKMAAAVQLARLFNPADVDWALGHAAVHGRFAEADLASILDHHRSRPNPTQLQASEDQSLTQGTRGWATYGTTNPEEIAS